jgi:hypothetical protein
MFEAVAYSLNFLVWLFVVALALIAIVNVVRKQSAGVPLTVGSFLVRLFVLTSVLAVVSDALDMYSGGCTCLFLLPITLLAAFTASACAVVAACRAYHSPSERTQVLALLLLLAGVGLWVGVLTRRTYLLGGYLMYATHACALREIERGYYEARGDLQFATWPPTEVQIPSRHFPAVYEVRNGVGYERIVVVERHWQDIAHCLVFSPHGPPRGRRGDVGMSMHLFGDWYVISDRN